MRMADDAGQHPQLLQAVMEINRDRRQWVLDRLRERLGTLEDRRVALLGLAFKPNTDDVREAVAIELIRLLQAAGARVSAYDPVAIDGAAAVTTGVDFCEDAYAATAGADAAVLVTEWNEFKSLDMERIRDHMRRPLLIDGRNLYDPAQLSRLGLEYVGVARGVEAGTPLTSRHRPSDDPATPGGYAAVRDTGREGNGAGRGEKATKTGG
jgi:UDPglucose 6-dehydrogenase